MLCIEDDPDLLLLIRLILGLSSAVRVLGASHGNKGLELARAESPSLVLLDLHLPDLPGEEVLRQLKADDRTRQVPVIVISGDLDARLSAHLLELGAIQCLQKPFSVSDFLLVIEAAADTV